MAEGGRQLVDQLRHELMDGDLGHQYGDHLRKPDPDRSSLLTAHLIVERLIESILETHLPFPDFWMPDEDFLSKLRLARALGLLKDDEYNVCRVLNSARNALAHKLEPLPKKWRDELKRLSSSIKTDPRYDPEDFQVILRHLVAIILGRRNQIVFHHKRYRLSEQHGDRWLELMKERLDEWFRSDHPFEKELLRLKVDLQIAQETTRPKSKG